MDEPTIEKPVMFVDTETNGLPKDWKKKPDASDNWPRIVQIAWLIQFDPDRVVKERNFYIKPDGWEIGDSEKIHGISPLVAASQGVPLREAMQAFIEDLKTVSLVVMHNVKFDRGVISSEMMRLGLSAAGAQYSFYCTMERGMDVVKIPSVHGYKWPSLEELHRYFFNDGFQEAHNAVSDVAACARSYWKLRIAEKL